MQRTLRVMAFLFFVLFPVAIASFGQSSIRSIEIDSEWGGLGTPSSSHLIIREKSGRFYSGSRRIQEANVRFFIDAIENAPFQKWGLLALGITDEWLKANAETALKGYLPQRRYENISSKQKELFLSSFSNYGLMESMLTKGPSNEAVEKEVDFDTENSHGVDDFPDIKIKISHSDGSMYQFTAVQNSVTSRNRY